MGDKTMATLAERLAAAAAPPPAAAAPAAAPALDAVDIAIDTALEPGITAFKAALGPVMAILDGYPDKDEFVTALLAALGTTPAPDNDVLEAKVTAAVSRGAVKAFTELGTSGS